MSEVSGSGDFQSGRLEPESADVPADQPVKEAVDKVTSGYDKTTYVVQNQTAGGEDLSAVPAIPVPTLQPALPGATVASSEDISRLLEKALVISDSLGQKSSGETVEPLPASSSEAVAEDAPGQPSREYSTVSAATPLQEITQGQSALPEATDTAQVPGVYESNIRQLTKTIEQASSAGSSAPLQVLSVVAANVSPSVAHSGSLAVQRAIDDIVSINRNSGQSTVHGAQGVQQNSADIYGMPEHVRLSLLSQKLGH